MSHPWSTSNPFASLGDDAIGDSSYTNLKAKKTSSRNQFHSHTQFQSHTNKPKPIKYIQKVIDYLAEVGLKHSKPEDVSTQWSYFGNISFKVLVQNSIGKEVVVWKVIPSYPDEYAPFLTLCIDEEHHNFKSLREFRDFVSDFLLPKDGREQYVDYIRQKQQQEEEEFENNQQWYREISEEDDYYKDEEAAHNRSWWQGLSSEKQHEELLKYASKGSWKMVDTLLCLYTEISEETSAKVKAWKKQFPRK